MEWFSGIVQWFVELPGLTQVFVGLFVFLMAIPIATLTVFQFIESIRAGRSSMKPKMKKDKE